VERGDRRIIRTVVVRVTCKTLQFITGPRTDILPTTYSRVDSVTALVKHVTISPAVRNTRLYGVKLSNIMHIESIFSHRHLRRPSTISCVILPCETNADLGRCLDPLHLRPRGQASTYTGLL
jgi:hypothetical protein